MTVLCPGCRRAMRVPPEKENVPNLRARCSACGTVFAVAEASLALAPARPPAPLLRRPWSSRPLPLPLPRRLLSRLGPRRRLAFPRPPPRRALVRPADLAPWRGAAARLTPTGPPRPSAPPAARAGAPTACAGRAPPRSARQCDALCVPPTEQRPARVARAAGARGRSRTRSGRSSLPVDRQDARSWRSRSSSACSRWPRRSPCSARLRRAVHLQGLLYAYAFTRHQPRVGGHLTGFMPRARRLDRPRRAAARRRSPRC